VRGRLGRYILFQARDYVTARGAPVLLVGALLLLLPVHAARVVRVEGMSSPDSTRLARELLLSLVQALAPIGTLISVNGIVSRDRTHGYYRFLFAKPISVARYYSQSFLVNGLGLALAMLILLGAFALLAVPVFPAGAVAYMGLYFISFGGLGFLYSVLSRYDWLLLAMTWFLALALRALYPAHGGGVGAFFNLVLPPAHLLQGMAAPLMRGAAVDSLSLLWVVGYGTAAFLLGLVALHRRSLAL
jgi:ABC-type transport system involved in multi-copper enzyme maturation permease subunit